MIKIISPIKETSPDKYEVKVGDRIRIHNRNNNISYDLSYAIRMYDDDTIFEVVAADRQYFILKVLGSTHLVDAQFIQRSNDSTSSYRFSQNYSLVSSSVYSLKDVAID